MRFQNIILMISFYDLILHAIANKLKGNHKSQIFSHDSEMVDIFWVFMFKIIALRPSVKRK